MLAKKYRLKTSFFKTKRDVLITSDQFFSIHKHHSECLWNRYAVVISKKIAPTAVLRNTTRRTIYEYIRKTNNPTQSHKNIVIFVKKPTLSLLSGDKKQLYQKLSSLL